MLEDYLQEYPGIIITVSHDRYFLDKLATRIFSFQHGEIIRYEGNYSDFKQAQKEYSSTLTTTTEKQPTTVSNSKTTWKQKDTRIKFSYKEQKEYETIDDDIAALEEKIATLEEEITKAATQYTKLHELMTEKEQAEQALEEKMERWVYLNDLAEQIAQGK